MYPEGTRNLTAQMASTLHSVHGAINVFEMAAGQYWRLVLDSWGLAGIGLIAALAVIVRPRFRADLRIMAALSAAVTLITAVTAPAALPADQSQTWASGRYLDGLIVTYFVVGAVVLLRARPRFILICAGITAVLTGLTAIIVSVYAGSSIPHRVVPDRVQLRRARRAGPELEQRQRLRVDRGGAGPARHLGADRAGGAALERRGRVVPVPALPDAAGPGGGRAGGGEPGGRDPDDQPRLAGRHAGPGAEHDRVRGGHRAQAARPDRGGLHRRHQRLPATDVPYFLWAPQAFEVSWTELEFFNPAQAPPAGVNVVETGWPAGQPASASWPHHPAGWRIVASNQAAGWVAWRHS